MMSLFHILNTPGVTSLFQVHKDINEQAEVIVEKVVKMIQDYADSLHQQVEDLAKDHRREVAAQAENSKNRLQAATSAKAFAEALLGFNRAEELVSMSKEVRSRLDDFQVGDIHHLRVQTSRDFMAWANLLETEKVPLVPLPCSTFSLTYSLDWKLV